MRITIKQTEINIAEINNPAVFKQLLSFETNGILHKLLL
jgi:hypothetical protein